MSKYTIPQEQIDTMSMEVLTELLSTLQDEMCELARLEYRLYKKRRDLERIKNPELFEPLETPKPQKPKRKLTDAQIQLILQAAERKGISLDTLL